MSAISNTFLKAKAANVFLEITPGAFAHLYKVSSRINVCHCFCSFFVVFFFFVLIFETRVAAVEAAVCHLSNGSGLIVCIDTLLCACQGSSP